MQRTQKLKKRILLCIVATCKIAECKSVRDPVSFVLQKTHEKAFEPDKTFKEQKQKYVARLYCLRVSSVENTSNKVHLTNAFSMHPLWIYKTSRYFNERKVRRLPEGVISSTHSHSKQTSQKHIDKVSTLFKKQNLINKK